MHYPAFGINFFSCICTILISNSPHFCICQLIVISLAIHHSSLFHSTLITCLFHVFFPPQTAGRHHRCTRLPPQSLDCFMDFVIFIVYFLCLCYSTVSANALCFRAVHAPRSFVRSSVRPDRSCYHDIS